ncbi:RipA family octameric membrane protein [Tenacibaculum maritimum]|uniref:RipA family octameric membrane protein n=1 Tax=Tenacibaculum maritimum TaxID=107401 RepID=UPI0038763F7A
MGLKNFEDIGYPDNKKAEHTLEQYKMYVESAEKVSDRRSNLNTFYLSLTTTITGVIGYLKTNTISNSEYLIIGLSISAILICVYWVNLLENYRKLNSGKFKVIHEIEKELPLNLYDYEWEKLGKGNDPKLYKKLSNVEKIIPTIFGFLFLLVVIIEFASIINWNCK